MRSRLLKLVAVGALTLVGAVSTAAVAGAGTMGPSGPPGVCTVTLSGDVTPDGTTTKAFPVSVVISGDAPEGATLLQLFVSSPINQPFVLGGETVPVDGHYVFPAITLNANADFKVGFFYGDQNAYTASCTDPSGADVIRVQGAEAAATAARPLAFTGSSGTTSTVLIALAAIALGVVLVVATRRRHRVDV